MNAFFIFPIHFKILEPYWYIKCKVKKKKKMKMFCDSSKLFLNV